MVMSKIPALDHFVHLVSNLDEAIALYSALGFLVIRGGTHADQITTNALIVFPDGVYLELIAFVKPEDAVAVTREELQEFIQRRNAHWWYGRQQGWIDLALLGGASYGRCDALTSSQESNIGYQPPIDGSRKTLDGKKLAWRVTFPEAKYPRGSVPFFCEDKTPREWRVPEMVSPHPNGTGGVTAVTLLVRPERFHSTVDVWRLILNSAPHPNIPDEKSGFRQQRTVVDGDEAVQLLVATPRGDKIKLLIKRAEDPQENRWIEQHGEGVFEVEVSGESAPRDELASRPPGKRADSTVLALSLSGA